MQTPYKQMRDDIHKVYHGARASTELQGVPTETLDLMREASIKCVDDMEKASQAENSGCSCGCGGCMKRPSNVTPINEPE